MGLTALASDDFNRADNVDLGTSWDVTPGGDSRFGIGGNAAVPSNFSVDCSESNNSIAWPSNQYAQAKVTVTGTDGVSSGIGIALRMSTSAMTYYRFVVDKAASNNVAIDKFIAGTFTTLARFTSAWTDGDVLQARAIGDRLEVYRNGTLLGSVGDNSILTGRAGIAYSSNETSASLDDWEGGLVEIGGSPADDRYRFRNSQLWSGTSTLGTKRSAWPDDARDFGLRDNVADNRSTF